MRRLVPPQLHYSHEYHQLKPPWYLGFSAVAITTVLVVGLVFSFTFEIEETVRGRATVRPTDNISVIRAASTGDVRAIHAEDAQYVEKGTELIEIDTDDQLSRLNELRPMHERRIRQRRDAGALIAAINEDMPNPFSPNESPRPFRRYDRIQAEEQRWSSEIREQELELQVIRDAPQAVQQVREIEFLERRLETLRAGKQAWESEILASYYGEVEELNEAIAAIATEIVLLRREISRGQRSAPTSGFVRVLRELNVGDRVSENEELFQVIPANDRKAEIRLEIAPDDVAKLREGMAVRIRFDALPSREYGFLEGTVTRIPGDAVFPDGEPPRYHLEATTAAFMEHESEGTEVRLRPGMVGEGRIIKRETRIVRFITRLLDWTQ